MAPPRPRPARTRCVHRARGGDRAHRGHQSARPDPGLHRSASLAGGQNRRPRVLGQRQPRPEAAGQRWPGRGGRSGSRDPRRRSRVPHPRDHRGRRDARHRRCDRQPRAAPGAGRQIAVDDFGTGYSSLAYLQRFPIDILKIDKTFVDRIDIGPEDAALPHAIIRQAQTLHLTPIAEGVERESQQMRLRELGCELAQGYYFACPAAPDAIAAILRSR